MPAPIIEYRGSHRFDLTPTELWTSVAHVERFEGWWSWLSEFSVDRDELRPGTVLRGAVTPPLPYRMRLRVVLDECVPAQHVTATVDGDLRGEARARFRPDGASGTVVDVAWRVEMMQRAMRIADRVAHPLLQWGHDRVVEMTVASFGRHLAAQAARSASVSGSGPVVGSAPGRGSAQAGDGQAGGDEHDGP